METNKPIFKCKKCKKSFSRQDHLDRHRLTHIKKRLHPCSYCGKAFANKNHLNEHTLSHGKSDVEKVNSKKHTDKDDGKNYKRDSCDKSFSQKYRLNEDIITHTRERPHKCEQCKKCFIHKSNLKNHIVTHTGERPHKCDHCNKSFVRKGDLNRHILIHERPHKCEVCNRCFNKKGDLNRHIMTHTIERPHKCEVCNRCFTKKGNLNQHIITHTVERPHKCEVCNRCFNKKGNLNRHIITHTGERSHQYRHCEKTFRQKSHLKKHILLTHSEEGPQKCEKYNNGVIEKNKLKKHILSHSNKNHQSNRNLTECNLIDEQSYKCEHCDRKFTSKITIAQHLRTCIGDNGPRKSQESDELFAGKANFKDHSDLSSFPREQCNKCIVEKVDLNNHAFKHTGEHPCYCTSCDSDRFEVHVPTYIEEKEVYRCDHCDKTFTSKSVLVEHIKKHTRQDVYESKRKVSFRVQNTDELINTDKNNPHYMDIDNFVNLEAGSSQKNNRSNQFVKNRFGRTVYNTTYRDEDKLDDHLLGRTQNQDLEINDFSDLDASASQEYDINDEESSQIDDDHFCCTICNDDFNDENELADHLLDCFENNFSVCKNLDIAYEDFVCSFCSADFYNEEELIVHICDCIMNESD